MQLPPLRAYQIERPETIRLVLPATAMARGVAPLVANPAIKIRPAAATLAGSLVGGLDAAAVRAAPSELRIALQADSFVVQVGQPGEASEAQNGGLCDVKCMCMPSRRRLLVRHPLAQICQLIDDGQAKLDERK